MLGVENKNKFKINQIITFLLCDYQAFERGMIILMKIPCVNKQMIHNNKHVSYLFIRFSMKNVL